MEAVIELAGTTMTRSKMAERVFADAHRSFASGEDVHLLQGQIAQIVDDLWTETTKVTTFIPVLALRDLRERVESQRGGRGV